MTIISPYITRLVALALDEDLAFGDVTSSVALPDGQRARASLIAKEEFVFCSAGILGIIIETAGASVAVSKLLEDGTSVSAGTTLAELEGETGEILSLERTMLNFVQRLSGVATKTRSFVDRAGALTVLDTRKTTPGWRLLEKHAVRAGGGRNHRMHLGELVLIKNNHIDAHGGDLRSLFIRVAERKPPYIPLEVEVRSVQELTEVLAVVTPDLIMFDNMANEEIARAVQIVQANNPAIAMEISGGITPDRLAALSHLPLYVSSGALTTQARSVDISLTLHGPV